MKKRWGKYYFALVVFLSGLTVSLFSCEKDPVITDKVAWETYINNTGKDMQIVRYMKGTSEKGFSIKNNDTLLLVSSLEKGADTTGTIFYADSANVLFPDGKTYMVVDTSKLTTNFLNQNNFVTGVSPSGKIHYFKYIFTEEDYSQAK